MTREPHEEMQMLLGVIALHGPEQTYKQMKAKGISLMEKEDSIDDTFLDMHEAFLKHARSFEKENKDDVEAKILYYTLASILRRLAHEMNLEYLKNGHKRKGNRFLRLVVDNPDSPVLDW